MATVFPLTAIAMIFFAVLVIVSVSEAGEANECTLSNVGVLSQFIDARINATVAARVAELSAALEERFDATVDERTAAAVNILNASIDEQTKAATSTVSVLDVAITRHISQPVMDMLYIAVSGNPRTVYLRSMSTATQEVGNLISTLTIQNPSADYTSLDNILAYRPYHSSNSGGNTAILFINLEATNECYVVNSQFTVVPPCNLFTLQEGSFQYGKVFIQASDLGNHFRIFNVNLRIATYGFGVVGCTTFDPACVSDFEVSLVCLLPPSGVGCRN